MPPKSRRGNKFGMFSQGSGRRKANRRMMGSKKFFKLKRNSRRRSLSPIALSSLRKGTPSTALHWHNWQRDAEMYPQHNNNNRPSEQRSEKIESRVRVKSLDGSVYEIDKKFIKYTRAEPRISFSMNVAEKMIPAQVEEKSSRDKDVMNSGEGTPPPLSDRQTSPKKQRHSPSQMEEGEIKSSDDEYHRRKLKRKAEAMQTIIHKKNLKIGEMPPTHTHPDRTKEESRPIDIFDNGSEERVNCDSKSRSSCEQTSISEMKTLQSVHKKSRHSSKSKDGKLENSDLIHKSQSKSSTTPDATPIFSKHDSNTPEQSKPTQELNSSSKGFPKRNIIDYFADQHDVEQIEVKNSSRQSRWSKPEDAPKTPEATVSTVKVEVKKLLKPKELPFTSGPIVASKPMTIVLKKDLKPKPEILRTKTPEKEKSCPLPVIKKIKLVDYNDDEDEDEEDFMPTNSIRIGSSRITLPDPKQPKHVTKTASEKKPTIPVQQVIATPEKDRISGTPETDHLSTTPPRLENLSHILERSDKLSESIYSEPIPIAQVATPVEAATPNKSPPTTPPLMCPPPVVPPESFTSSKLPLKTAEGSHKRQATSPIPSIDIFAPAMSPIKEKTPPEESMPSPKKIVHIPYEVQKANTIDILKSLENDSSEVDDFLQKIQEQRQQIEQKVEKSHTPLKKPFFDIGSVEMEVKQKLQLFEELDDYPIPPLDMFSSTLSAIELSLPKHLLKRNSELSPSNSSPKSSITSEGSSDSSESDSDSQSGSSSSGSSSSDSSSSAENEADVEKVEVEKVEGEKADVGKAVLDVILKPKEREVSTPVPKMEVDLTSSTRNPIMMKIQSKPKVVVQLKPLTDEKEDDEEEVAEQVIKKMRKKLTKLEKSPQAEPKIIQRSTKADTQKPRRESRPDCKAERRRTTSGSRPKRTERPRRPRIEKRKRSLTPVRLHRDEAPLKDRRRRRDRSRRDRVRTRSKSPPKFKKGSRSSSSKRRLDRSRSRSRSKDRGTRSRKRSPWRPPVDFWDNLSVPPASWSYMDDNNYYAQSYYNEQYNNFEPAVVNSAFDQNFMDPSVWNNAAPPPQSASLLSQNPVMMNGGSGSPHRISLDDRINSVLNDGPYSAQQHPHPPRHAYNNENHDDYHVSMYPSPAAMNPNHQHHHHHTHYNHPPQSQFGGNYQSTGYANYQQNHPGDTNHDFYNHSNLLNCNQTKQPTQSSAAPFALQKGNVIELVPNSSIDSGAVSSGYQSEETPSSTAVQPNYNNPPPQLPPHSVVKYNRSSEQRKALREKKRLEKKMRKKKLELELKELLEGGTNQIDIGVDEQGTSDKPSMETEVKLHAVSTKPPPKVEFKKVVFSDGVLPGDGTSDSTLDSSDEMQAIDISELTANQLKKYRKRRRKRKESNKENALKTMPVEQNTVEEIKPPVEAIPVAPEPAPIAVMAAEVLNLPAPPPPPNDPPSHLVQPTLKAEVMEQPKKLLYFNTLHRERRMDFFSICVPPTMFVRLNDPRLLRGHPGILNRRRIPQPIYPPNVYPPPPQPYPNLPPLQISGGLNARVTSQPPPPTGQVIPTGVPPPALVAGIPNSMIPPPSLPQQHPQSLQMTNIRLPI